MPHLIELSKTYQLGVTDAGYVVYQLELDSDINLRRTKVSYGKTFDGVLEFLIRCELQNENVNNLADVQKVIEAIKAEIWEAIISAMCGCVLFNQWRMTGLFRSAPVINKPPMPTIICARF